MGEPAGPRAWQVVGVAGLVLCATYPALPAGGHGQAAIVLGLQWVSAGLVAWRVVRCRSAQPRLWLVLLAGLGAYTAATAIWYPSLHVAVALPFPSPVDAVYFTAYGLIGGFLLAVLHHRSAGGPVDERWVAILDASLFTLAVSAVLWVALVAPTLTQQAGAAPQAVALAYPAALAVLMGLAVRLQSGSPQPVRDALVVLWIGGELAGNVLYGVSTAAGTFALSHPMFLGWLLSYTALAALALHPDLLDLPAPPPTAPPRGSRRLAPVLLAALVPAVVHLVVAQDRVTAAMAVLSTLVIIARVRLVSGDLDEQALLAAQLQASVAHLDHLAHHDPLTGLANRTRLLQRLEHLHQHHIEERGVVAAVLLLDLDGFKVVNDTLGHAAGDALLREVGARVARCVRPADTVARLGGDEFAVVMADVDPAAVEQVAQAIVGALHRPVDAAGTPVGVRASIGIRLVEEPITPGVALRDADMAMYAAKALGGDRHVQFTPGMHAQLLDRRQLELELRDATARGEMRLLFQPIVELESLRTLGAEALIRWQHPTRGLLAPGAFIDIAEESGAITELGRWALGEACRTMARWRRHLDLPPGFYVSVNLSRRQLRDPCLVGSLRDIVVRQGCGPGEVVLEVTESALMADTEVLVERLQVLRDQGFTIAMDDFGIGYSSLGQLRALPIDILKIDRSFVTDIASGSEAFTLASAIVKLADGLGKRTLAEGVETPGQMAHLRAIGIRVAQGYLFGCPVPGEAMRERLLLETNSTAHR